MSETIPFKDFGGNGEVIHLAHANGFPPRSYQQLVDELTESYRVIAMSARPLWPNSKFEDFKSWREAADDLIQFLDERKLKNIIGMGHSFGAICTVIAANKRPDLFSKLILIEPVVLPRWFYLSNLMPLSVVKMLNPLIKKTLERTERWKDCKTVFAHFRNKKVFSLMDDESLWNYVNAVTTEDENGEVWLNYSKEWEAQIFLTVTNPWKELRQLKHPFLAIKGETSDTIFPRVWDKWKSINNTGELIEIEGCGHLVPFEKPDILSKKVVDFLKR